MLWQLVLRFGGGVSSLPLSPVPILLELSVPEDAPLMVQQSHGNRQLATDSYLTVHNATLTLTTQDNKGTTRHG